MARTPHRPPKHFETVPVPAVKRAARVGAVRLHGAAPVDAHDGESADTPPPRRRASRAAGKGGRR